MSSGRLLIIALFPLLPFTWADARIDCNQCHRDMPPENLAKILGLSEKAVGIMDKGQIQNNTSNFGDLASFHVWFTNAVHWPRNAQDDHQYAFGLGLVVAVNDTNVIETVTQSQSKIQDWLPPDDAAGRHFSGDVRAVSDETPFQASSDYRETWPRGFYDQADNWISTGERTWPGWFRVDVNHPDYPDSILEVENEFTSDRDIYCIFNDDYNTRGRVGIEVEQTAYSYGRPYAEDVLFWEFLIHNTSARDLEDIHVGFIAKFRPDYDNHDYINLIDSDGDGNRDLIYVYDLNNEPNRTWAETDDPLGIVGLRIYDTPGQMGVTDFHHFARGVSPTTDEEMWAIMTSDRNHSSLKDPRYYFHGSNPRIDYTGTDSLAAFYPAWLDEESQIELEGDAINYMVSCGPFTLEAGGSVPLSLGLIMGDAGTVSFAPDTSDLMNNVRTANEMYRLKFQGSGPPSPPVVYAVPGDGTATLYWSADPSESSIDVLTGKQDFEGYKIFRSTDQGLTWGKPVTDAYGTPVGYRPIAVLDLDDDVEGPDPAFPQDLGSNSGLVHTYIDSNLINGVEYWYCVTAYDQGIQDPDSLEPSYMYPLGASVFESHTVAVIPGPIATDQAADQLLPIGGTCEGIARVIIVEPDSVTGHDYSVSFTNTAILADGTGDTVERLGVTLVDTTEMDTLLNRYPVPGEPGEFLPIVDGFLLLLENVTPGVKFIDWTEVAADTCTFDWRYQSIDPNAPPGMLYQEAVFTTDDWLITVDYSPSGGLEATWCDAFSGLVQDEPQQLPLRVHVITDPGNPLDVSEHTWQYDFAIAAAPEYRKNYYSPLGWDLEPGGKGYTVGSPGWYEKHVDFLEFVKIDLDPVTGDTIPNWIRLFTNNKPDTSTTVSGETLIIDARAPSDGDQFTIITNKPFRPAISYAFRTAELAALQAFEPEDADPLANVRVVPDPYIVTNAWETSEFGKKLQFRNLPAECTIRIYTLAGNYVTKVDHASGLGYVFWDMRNHNDQYIAPGVYLYAITTPDGDEALGRFLVIK